MSGYLSMTIKGDPNIEIISKITFQFISEIVGVTKQLLLGCKIEEVEVEARIR